MATLEPEFLTFEELTRRWSYSKTYLHDLIRTGRLIPAVALSDEERYPGGEFRGGSFVGDIDTAKHKSYAEYYVGNVDEDNHPENWPQCERIVFCHSPSDDGENGYSFQFFTESPDPGNIGKWFYFDNGYQITSNDGERRFRFSQSEIKRFEVAQSDTKRQSLGDGTEKDLPQDTKSEAKSWQTIAREIADEFDLRDIKSDVYSSQHDMSERVAKRLREERVHGPRGPLSPQTVLKEALQGGQWKRPQKNKPK